MLHATVAALSDELSGYATRGLAVLEKLESAREAVRMEGESLREAMAASKLQGELEGVRKLLESGGSDAALRRALPMLEDIARRVEHGEGSVSEAAAAFAEQVEACGCVLDKTWRSWLGSPAEVLFRGARALALQPPNNLSEGLDGLDRERAALDQAKTILALAERVDLLRVSATSLPRCHEALRSDCCERLSAELQVAIRLATTAHGAADSTAVLEAIAEAAATSARAVRSLASVFVLMPPPAGATTAEVAGPDGPEVRLTLARAQVNIGPPSPEPSTEPEPPPVPLPRSDCTSCRPRSMS